LNLLEGRTPPTHPTHAHTTHACACPSATGTHLLCGRPLAWVALQQALHKVLGLRADAIPPALVQLQAVVQDRPPAVQARVWAWVGGCGRHDFQCGWGCGSSAAGGEGWQAEMRLCALQQQGSKAPAGPRQSVHAGGAWPGTMLQAAAAGAIGVWSGGARPCLSTANYRWGLSLHSK